MQLSSSPQPNKDTKGRPLQVMVIEDSKFIRDSLIDLINASEHCIVTAYAEGQEEAIKILRQELFDVIVLDLQLKQGSGIGILKSLQNLQKSARPLCIVLTNYYNDTLRAQCLSLGADFYFDKSSEFDKVSATIDEWYSQSNEH